MKIVVDTSVIICVILNEPHKANIIKATKGAVLLSPASLHWEIGNAFSAMFKQNRITMKEVKQALHYYEQIPIRYCGISLEKSLEIATVLKIYAYDAYFIACAKSFNAPLISLDKVLLNNANSYNIQTIEVVR